MGIHIRGDKLMFEKLSKYIEIALFAKEKRRKKEMKNPNGINIVYIKNQR